MIIKGVYLDKSVFLKKLKDSFEILSYQENLDYTINVLPPSDVLVLLKDISLPQFISLSSLENTVEISGYTLSIKKPIDFEADDIWVFALLRALEAMDYDNLYVVFKDACSYILCEVKDKTLTYYEVFFDEDELTEKLNTLEGNILFDIEDIDIKSLKILPMLYVKKGELLAFGGALKKIRDKFYKKDIISLKKLKKELVNVGVLSFAILFCYIVSGFLIDHQIKIVKQKENEVFEKAFPNTPVVDIKEQVRALMIPKDSFRVSKLLLKSYQNLPSDAKVYELFYKNNALTVKSQVNAYEVKSLKNITYSRALPSNEEEITQTWILGR